MSEKNNPFSIISETGGETVTPLTQNSNAPINDRIKELIGSSELFLFMKGNPDFPQCGFSANVIQILSHLQKPFKTFDILSDQDIRQGVKEFANWPTFPQLYSKGELIGGHDIIVELFESGDLKEALGLE